MVILKDENTKREMIVSQIDKNMFVEAGAGAGKTTLIKNRIVNQLKSGIRPEEIVAITFTNAATHELRERIIDAAMSEAQKDNITGEQSKNLKEALDHIDQMQISTIHSFCNRILKERSLDAGMPMNITLVEDKELDRLKEESFIKWAEGLQASDWNELLVVAKYRSSAIEMLKNLTNQLISVDPDLPIEMGLEPIDQATFEKKAKQYLDQFEKLVASKTTVAYGGVNKSIVLSSMADIPDAWLASEGKQVRDCLAANDLRGALKVILSKCESYKTGSYLVKNVTKSYYKDALNGILKGKDKDVKVDELYNAGNQALSEIIEWVENNFTDLNELLGGYENFLFAPYIKFAKQARDYFYENLGSDILTNDLMIQKTYRLLASSEDSRRYFSEKFKCIYVDEFQDTDHIQDSFIRLLAGELDDPCKLRDGALFVVGDPKQSIYRFRGAEPEVYFKTKEFFANQDNAYVLELQDNYRSNNGVIDWVNAQFAAKDITPGQSYVPMNVTKTVPESMMDDKTICGIYRKTSLLEVQEDKTIENDIDEVSNLILNLVNNGYKIVDFKFDEKTKTNIPTPRRIKFSDFLVLCANMNDMQLYAESFRAYGIPMTMDAKLTVSKQWYLKTFYRAFCFLISQYDRTSRVALEEGLIVLHFTKEQAKFIMEEMCHSVEGMSPAGVLYYLEKNWKLFLGINREYEESTVRKIQARITQMVTKAVSASNGSANGIRRTLKEYLESQVEHELTLEEGADVVRFMNLHKSKGLEGGIVIWANRQENVKFRPGSMLAGEAFYPSISGKTGALWCAYNRCDSAISNAKMSDAAENIRLEYVAVTRAKHACIFMDRFKKNTRSTNEVLFGEGYSLGDRSVKGIIEEKKNIPSFPNPYTEEQMVMNTKCEKEEQKKALYISESPSDFEDEKAAKDSKVKRERGMLPRPMGGVFGTTLHRTIELLVGRYMVTHNIPSEDALYETCLPSAMIESCYLQAISESIDEIEKSDVEAYKSFLKEVVMSFGRWWTSNHMGDQIEEFYPELPFSYFMEKEDNVVWRHGFADLVLKLKTGDFIIIDYKSDNDEIYDGEEGFLERLRGKYGAQLEAYKDAVETLFGVSRDRIKTQIISFSQKDVAPGEKLRVRITEVG